MQNIERAADVGGKQAGDQAKAGDVFLNLDIADISNIAHMHYIHHIAERKYIALHAIYCVTAY